MKSTDHNLNNPTQKETVSLYESIINKATSMINVTQEDYSKIGIKDPLTIYKIIGASKMYFGSIELTKPTNRKMYVMSSPNEYGYYPVYLIENGIMQKIEEFDNIHGAISSINIYNFASGHSQKEYIIATALINEYDDDIITNPINTCILIMKALGYDITQLSMIRDAKDIKHASFAKNFKIFTNIYDMISNKSSVDDFINKYPDIR